MQKQQITIIVGIVGVLLIGWGIFSVVSQGGTSQPQQNATSTDLMATSTQSAATTTPASPMSLGNTAGGLSISNVTVNGGTPGLKPYLNRQYGFIFAYTGKDAVEIPVNIPASDATPLLYRTDREFAFCVKERRTSMGCAPAVTLGLADGSGHGVSIYVLNNADVKALYPEFEANMFLDESTGLRYEVYYSDTTSINATEAQNKRRQQLMAEIIRSFTLLK